MSYIELNWIGVILAAIASMVIGSLWYSPLLFGKMWMKEMGLRNEANKEMWKAYAAGFAISLLTAFVLAEFLKHLAVQTVADGACVGFWAWLGFSLTAQFSRVLWEKNSYRLFLINSGYMLVNLSVMGAILAYWK